MTRTRIVVGVRVDAHVDRNGRVALRPVLDGVHHGLGDRGLEALEARGLEAQRRDRLRDALHGLALVADRALDGEGEERLVNHVFGDLVARQLDLGPGLAPSWVTPAERRSVTSVMSSSCSNPGP